LLILHYGLFKLQFLYYFKKDIFKNFLKGKTMKRVITVLIFLIVCAGYSHAQQWTFVSYMPGASPAVNSICVVSNTVIWAACAASGSQTNVYLSTNGGVNWILRNGGIENTKNMYGIYAFDETTCLVGSVDGDIYRTSNGGVNWTKVLDLTDSFTDGIYMFNTNYGIYYADPTADGQPYQIRITTNGGFNWSLVPNAPIASSEFGVINAWDWTDSNHVWLGSANTVPSSTSAKVYKTTNGFYGNWSNTVVSGTGGENGCYYQAIAFVNNTDGMIGSSGGNIKKTTDGGLTYSAVSIPSGITGSFSVITMNAIKDGSNTIRLSTRGDTSRVYRTTNLGTSWIREAIPNQAATGQVQHIQFLDINTGFASLGSSNSNPDPGGLIKYTGSVGISGNVGNVPSNYKLEQNFPNPFNPATTIKFSLPKSGFVALKVYDLLGKEVETLVSETMIAGNHEIFFDASKLNSGVYFYKLFANSFADTKKMMLVK
jgi:photosystem II stability/assembly factor-like uncharacterized protein